MSATRTFTVLKSSAIVTGDDWTFTRGENTRQALDIAAYCGLSVDLGGSDDVGLLTAAYLPVIGARDLTLNGDTLGGLTVELVVSSRTADAATAVTVRLRNVTDGATPTGGTSTPHVSPTLTTETLTPTLASGVKVYRLEVIGADALNAVYGYAFLRARKVAA